jgi:hypothetical protein
MASVRFILEITPTGSLIARSIDEPAIIVADDLADLRQKLMNRFPTTAARPVLVAVRAADVSPSAAPAYPD